MQRVMLKSKVHRATVTQADLHYEGSLTLDTLLMDAANLLPFEKIQVLNVTNGERFETYVIEGEPGSGVVCLNGAAARKGARGDLVILVSYAVCSEDEARDNKPDLVFVDEKNRMVRKMSGHDEVIIDKASLNLA
ncbi:MAG: aspartate 1-decarboxylase [Deltaproteobacteria bacterium]|nr:aspartate 1-decarboxylase [Deltaproteobacteria bacterium]